MPFSTSRVVRCFLKLCQLPTVIDELQLFSADVRIENLLCGWFDQLLSHALQDNQKMETEHDELFSSLLEKTLNTVKFNSKILKFIIDGYIKHFNGTNDTYLVSLASMIERK